MNCVSSAELICSLDGDSRSLGGKAHNLRILEAHGLRVPSLIVLDAITLLQSLELERVSLLEHPKWTESGSSIRRNMILQSELSDRAMKSIEKALKKISINDKKLAVRSSCSLEDGAETSFAGQFTSLGPVLPDDLSFSIKQVCASAYSDELIFYRRARGISGELLPLSVIVQEWIEPLVSGIAFGACPISGDSSVNIINAIYGPCAQLAAGTASGAYYKTRNGKLLDASARELGELSRHQLIELNAILARVKEIFGCPQDIEWAYDEKGLHILQSRPITTIAPKQEIRIWDNSNISESYPGVTTPLTFSFVRGAYEHVYRNFAGFMRVGNEDLDRLSSIFPQMLGFIQGRIYYNLLNWYRLLAVFPLFNLNGRFMEQMMGTASGIDAETTRKILAERKSKNKFAETIAALGSFIGIVWALLRLPVSTAEFHNRVDLSLAANAMDPVHEHASPRELAARYRQLEKNLLHNWQAPVVNDFFAMVFYGLLKSLCQRWSNEEGLHNILLSGKTGIVSALPALEISKLAGLLYFDKQSRKVLMTFVDNSSNDSISLTEVLAHLPEDNKFAGQLEEYVQRFGDRCLGELKLESLTLRDDISPLLRAILSCSRVDTSKSLSSKPLASKNHASKPDALEIEISQSAHLRKSVRGAHRRLILDCVRRLAAYTLANRENMRFERTRVFGAVRRIFLAVGKHMAHAGVIESERDIFFLEVDEILNHINGTSTTIELGALVRLRRNEYLRNAKANSPGDRLQELSNSLSPAKYVSVGSKSNIIDDADQLLEIRGSGCSAGVVKARACVVIDPEQYREQAISLEGRILVAERTDPGWITLMAQSAAIVVEYGSLLSHTAIVARELSIPAVVAAKGVCRAVSSGDLLLVDGNTGSVKVLSSKSEIDDSLEEKAS
jgi:rifampicin phosphotransferase